MKLRNKKTGEIGELNYYDGFLQVVDTTSPLCGNSVMGEYATFSAINEEWEDAPEEPKEFWFIGEDSCVHSENDTVTQDFVDRLESIGNYFSSREEAEKVVEKLKAWKRLKDKGFRFEDFEETDRGELGDFTIYAHIEPDYSQKYDEFDDDLYLLFCTEENS